VVAKVNTGQGVLFQETNSFRLIDTTAPAGVTDLNNITYVPTYINWTWIDPADADFANVSIWIDGIFKDNVSKGTQFYNATGLAPDTEHTIATRTADKSGNTNAAWVNHTARTAPAILPQAINVSIRINPDHINPKSKGKIKITIFNNTPPGFDVGSINISTVRFGPAGAKVDKYKIVPSDYTDDRYLFSWDNVPGDDNGKLVEFLERKFSVDWASAAKIEKLDGDRTIRVYAGRNSLSLELNDEKTKVNLNINDAETDEFTAEMENGKLKIHDHRKLVLYFNTEDTGIQCGDTLANLTGKTYNGQDIAGSDNIRTVGCGGSGRGGGGSGGGGGGGGVSSGEPFDNIAMYETRDGSLQAGHPVTFSFSKAGHWISEIVITGKESENDVSIRVEALKGRSRLAAVDIPGAKYMDIWINTKKVKEALIRFKVENSWIASGGISSGDVRMYRWNGGKWDKLETTVIKKDASYTYFEAETPGFSPFAVGGPEAGKAKLFGTMPWPEESTSTVTETPEATESPSKKAPPINLAVIIGLVGLIAAVAYVYIKRKVIFK
jgi:PGF-pre-PGF domain-containing protein